MVKNQYIDRSVQKGFLQGMAGCVEHTFSLHHLLKDAFQHHRQIIVSWIDLANAYGSIMHNLIQFALEWYHVPVQIREIIFNYYAKLSPKIGVLTSFLMMLAFSKAVCCLLSSLISSSTCCWTSSSHWTSLGIV